MRQQSPDLSCCHRCHVQLCALSDAAPAAALPEILDPSFPPPAPPLPSQGPPPLPSPMHQVPQLLHCHSTQPVPPSPPPPHPPLPSQAPSLPPVQQKLQPPPYSPAYVALLSPLVLSNPRPLATQTHALPPTCAPGAAAAASCPAPRPRSTPPVSAGTGSRRGGQSQTGPWLTPPPSAARG